MCLGGEGLLTPAARAVQPPDLPVGMLLRQGVEHGHDRRGADAGADQQHGRMGPVEDEGAARRCDIELIADGEPGVEIAAGAAVGFPLDGDAVMAGAGRSRQRVVAEHDRSWIRSVRYWPGRAAGSAAPPGSSSRIEITESLSRSIPATLSRRKPGQAGGGLVTARPALPPPALSVEQGAERRLPAGAERGDPERTEYLLSRVPGEVEQPVDLGDRHLLRPGGDLEDLVTGLDLALFEHAEVEAGAAVGDQQRRMRGSFMRIPTR